MRPKTGKGYYVEAALKKIGEFFARRDVFEVLIYRRSSGYGVLDHDTSKAERILHDHLETVVGIYDRRAQPVWIVADLLYFEALPRERVK